MICKYFLPFLVLHFHSVNSVFIAFLSFSNLMLQIFKKSPESLMTQVFDLCIFINFDNKLLIFSFNPSKYV